MAKENNSISTYSAQCYLLLCIVLLNFFLVEYSVPSMLIIGPSRHSCSQLEDLIKQLISGIHQTVGSCDVM